MSKFTPTNRSNDCPVCGDISGKCRTKDDGGQAFVLCVTEGSAKQFDIVNGYKCIGNKNSRWATFTLDNDSPQKSYEERQQLRQQREAEERERYQSGLNPSDRQATHTQLLAQLALHPDDRADLLRRGLSAATVKRFRSVKPWQKLTQEIAPRTPGIGSDGQKVATKYRGYIVPALDLEGRELAYQIRNRQQAKNEPKYPWLSTYTNPANIQNGELPLTYIPGEGSAINLAEGLLKPMVAGERLGQSFIGAAGGMFASSPKQFEQWINTLNPTELILCPDGGAVTNTDVIREYSKLAELVESLGRSLKVRWWGQATKDDGDVDEISREQFEAAQLITWTEFLAMVPENKKPATTAYEKKPQRISAPLPQTTSAQTKEKPQTKTEWLKAQKLERDRNAYEKTASMLGIEASIDTSAEDYKAQARAVFYEPLKQQLKYEVKGELISGFASEIKAEAGTSRTLSVYDCSQGTGKSNNALIPQALQTAKDGGRVLIIVPTRGLATEFKSRINERAGEDIAATHLDPNYYSAAIVVSCPESAYKFKGQKFELIQIDEANEGHQRIESAELGNAGPQSLAAFRTLLATTPKLAVATAAMSGWTLAAAQTIGGFTPNETYIQRRVRPATEMNIVEYGNFYQWLQRIIDALREGKRVAIPVGSRGKGRMIDRVLREMFPDKTGLVIDGASTLQNQRTQFLADPDAFLSVAQPDWFIFTPVINSGVSIEGRHFDIQFEYATPNEGAQSISQRGERIRSAIGRDGTMMERHIYFSQQGAPTLEAYPDAFNWQYWADELANDANAPMGAAAALAKALGAEKALKPMQQEAEKFAGMRPHLPHFMALKAFEIIFKKELLHEDWERYGWHVSAAPEMDKAQAEQAHQLHLFCDQVRIGLIEQQGRTLKKTRTREAEGELDEINNPFQATRATKAQLEKLLGKDYLSQQDSDFFTAWSADKSANNPGIGSVVRSQLMQIAISAPESWQQIERMKALKFLAGKPDPDSDLFWSLPELPAAARDIELVSIISRCPGITDVISGKTERWTNKDPQVVAAGLYLVIHSKQLAANTKRKGLMKGDQFSEELAPASLFNKALALMGYKPAKNPKREGSGDRQNLHRLAVEADAIQALEDLKADGEDGLKLFRAKLRVIRAQTQASIEAAAKSQIVARALAWVTEKTGGEVQKAIAAIQRRQADLNKEWLTKVGDGLNLDVEKLPDKLAQMALLGTNTAIPPPTRTDH
ncbi:MAG: hypothetical protein DCF25_06620 [Leptolyngbya foveolarum]|uniref:Uncharacterized protein n=1 Tax=Leptolyngbya foveolarum TaxID=47253 RepID=A0A2W4WM66_9CYAN|nr:MAG: hypothetical protein DCF25_06620 [Leptolyngbya foveolarum]